MDLEGWPDTNDPLCTCPEEFGRRRETEEGDRNEKRSDDQADVAGQFTSARRARGKAAQPKVSQLETLTGLGNSPGRKVISFLCIYLLVHALAQSTLLLRIRLLVHALVVCVPCPS